LGTLQAMAADKRGRRLRFPGKFLAYNALIPANAVCRWPAAWYGKALQRDLL